jgi:hypothetical protein
MGVVTKMGFGLMPNPGDHESYVRFSRFYEFAQWLTDHSALHISKGRGSQSAGKKISSLTAYIPSTINLPALSD